MISSRDATEGVPATVEMYNKKLILVGVLLENKKPRNSDSPLINEQ